MSDPLIPTSTWVEVSPGVRVWHNHGVTVPLSRIGPGQGWVKLDVREADPGAEAKRIAAGILREVLAERGARGYLIDALTRSALRGHAERLEAEAQSDPEH